LLYEGVRLQCDDGKSIRYWPTGATVSGNTFEYSGVAPYLGRSLSEQDAKPDAPFVFVMNYRFWQSEFGGDPKILGGDFILEGKPRTLSASCPAIATRSAKDRTAAPAHARFLSTAKPIVYR
jgi:hypothetical protein